MNSYPRPSTYSNTEVFVLAWPGNEELARRIVDEVGPFVSSIRVLYNSGAENKYLPPGWFNLGADAYFGKKFAHIIENGRSDVQLLVPADCTVADWKKLLATCSSAFERHDRLAIWAPHTEGTAWTLDRTCLRRVSRTTFSVTTVDSLIWALKGPFLRSLPKLDFSSNTFGWGIETAVAAEAHLQGKLVLVDTSITFSHVRGSAYSSDLAEQTEINFLQELPRKTLRIVRIIQFIFTHRKQGAVNVLSFPTTLKLCMHVMALTLRHLHIKPD